MRYISKNFFTLLELLIVIAIITILAALLLPSLTKAKAITRKTQCASNVRQIEIGALSYYSDAAYHAAYWTAWYGGSWPGTEHVLSNYLPDTITYIATVLKTGKKSRYACPDVNVDPTVNQYTVGCNVASFGPGNTLTDPSRSAYLNRWYNGSKIKKPSAVCHFADAGPGLDGAPLGNNTITYRHLNSANASYLDGHCGSVKLYPTSALYSSTQDYKTFWGTDTSLYP